MTAAGERQEVRVDRAPVGVFVLVAFAGAWVVCVPLWLTPRHLGVPWAQAVLAAMMYTPALGVLVATRLRRTPGLARQLGLGFGGSFRRCVPYFLFALLAVPALSLAAPFVAALLGVYDLDVHLSLFRETLAHAPGGRHLSLSPTLLAAAQLASIPVAAVVPNGLLTFGEEIGWRGFLLPRLLPLGQWPALVIVGVVWGLWHTPVLLLGFDYPLHHGLAVPLMVGFTVVVGILIGWLRLSTGSIWPGVLAHGALNASAGSVGLFLRAGSHADTALAGITGITGWILPLLVIGLLVAMRRLPVRHVVVV
ncbi:MAG TPA: CPBP family intramembrane glutamic endopeptidase [Streptosporangiales bacterium]